jgi:hypothetical protein
VKTEGKANTRALRVSAPLVVYGCRDRPLIRAGGFHSVPLELVHLSFLMNVLYRGMSHGAFELMDCTYANTALTVCIKQDPLADDRFRVWLSSVLG